MLSYYFYFLKFIILPICNYSVVFFASTEKNSWVRHWERERVRDGLKSSCSWERANMQKDWANPWNSQHWVKPTFNSSRSGSRLSIGVQLRRHRCSSSLFPGWFINSPFILSQNFPGIKRASMSHGPFGCRENLPKYSPQAFVPITSLADKTPHMYCSFMVFSFFSLFLSKESYYGGSHGRLISEVSTVGGFQRIRLSQSLVW